MTEKKYKPQREIDVISSFTSEEELRGRRLKSFFSLESGISLAVDRRLTSAGYNNKGERLSVPLELTKPWRTDRFA
jgi:hypothetical protein